jgi:hypothetical protein
VNTNSDTPTIQPPRLISSLQAGFNTVANHIYLILFPLVFDLLLWFGPRLRLKTLMQPFITDLFEPAMTLDVENFGDIVAQAQTAWGDLLESFNLFSVLRTFPIGLPSLLAAEGTLDTPLGNAQIIELPTAFATVGLWIVFSLVGVVLGCFYFQQVARQSTLDPDLFPGSTLARSVLQTIGLAFFLFLLILIITIPTSLMVFLFGLFSGFLAQIALLMMSFILLWLAIPMIFSPHGIFAKGQNFLSAVLSSVRMVRMTLPMTGLFILMLILLVQGLNVLWRVPPTNSWMKLVGVAGHAFVSTATLSASFIYYQQGTKWVEERIASLLNNEQTQSNDPSSSHSNRRIS